jgi:hypothetical protein
MIRRIIKGCIEVIRTEYAWFKIRVEKRRAVRWAR